MKTYLKLALLTSAAVGLGVLYLGTAGAQITNLGPSMSTVSAGASATLAALPANPTRHALTICNGHASQSVTFTFGAADAGVSDHRHVNVIASGASTPVTFFEY